jgi:cold shock CspA family protein
MLNNDRQQGELLKWFEKFGYGFIRSHNSSEPDVFVHVSQFPSDIIPDIGAKVSFVIGKGKDGRRQAKHVEIIEE